MLAFLVLEPDTRGNATNLTQSVASLINGSFPEESYQKLQNILSDCDHALCGRAKSPSIATVGQAHIGAFKQAVYLSAFKQDVAALEKILALSTDSYGIETLTTTLECIAETWIPDQSDDILQRLAIIHLAALKAPASARIARIRASTLENICLILNAVNDLGSPLFHNIFEELDDILTAAITTYNPVSPILATALDTMASISITYEVLSTKPLQPATKRRIQAWGLCLQINSRDEKVI